MGCVAIVVIIPGAGPWPKPGYVKIAGGGAIGLDSAFDDWSGVALLVMETLRQSALKKVAPFSVAGAWQLSYSLLLILSPKVLRCLTVLMCVQSVLISNSCNYRG